MGYYNLVYSITNSAGCSATKTNKVFLGSNPAVGFTAALNADICVGSTLSFPLTSTNNNPPGTTFEVSFSDGSIENYTQETLPATISHTFDKNSCGYSYLSCGQTVSQNVNSITQNDSISKKPSKNDLTKLERQKQIEEVYRIDCIRLDIALKNAFKFAQQSSKMIISNGMDFKSTQMNSFIQTQKNQIQFIRTKKILQIDKKRGCCFEFCSERISKIEIYEWFGDF